MGFERVLRINRMELEKIRILDSTAQQTARNDPGNPA